ncbi:uncharacterized protein LOC123347721 [Mauremys mutica]|uniref:uncharacterized protein LOC123347721 n=1 Tax=Mauremys mutica TaxID=74926 RepID=UPI001D16AC18|nr:uncharacterized protein LOC123347721 [Mauremys mutica]
MTWLSAALLALAPCALSQVQLAASGPGVGQVSEPLTLTCAVSGGSITADYWDWYRQLPRGALDWLGEIDWYNSQWRVDYAPSVQGRVTLSADSSKNQFSLQLRSLTAADTATYYCARRDTVTQRQGPVRQKGGNPYAPPGGGLIPPGLSPSLSPPLRGTRWGALLFYRPTSAGERGTQRETHTDPLEDLTSPTFDLQYPGPTGTQQLCRVTGQCRPQPGKHSREETPGRARAGGLSGKFRLTPPSISGALSQVRLVESGPGVGKVSEPLALSCAVSGESIASSDYLWYRIPASAEAGLEYLGVITRSGTPFPAQSLRNRLSISRDTAKSQVSLQLLSLRAADSAAYHCARREAQRHGHGGAGTKRGVNVTGTFGAAGGRGRDQLREAHPSGAEKGPKLKAGGLEPSPARLCGYSSGHQTRARLPRMKERIENTGPPGGSLTPSPDVRLYSPAMRGPLCPRGDSYQGNPKASSGIRRPLLRSLEQRLLPGGGLHQAGPRLRWGISHRGLGCEVLGAELWVCACPL